MQGNERRDFLAMLAAGSASALAGCGGGSTDSSGTPTGTTTTSSESGSSGLSGQQLTDSYRFRRGDMGRTGSFPDRSAPSDAVTESWTFDVQDRDQIKGPPVAAGGAIYVVIGGTVYAFNPFDGAELWTADPGGLEGTLAVVDGTLYATGGQNQLYALDAATGAQQWQYDTENTKLASPVVADGTVFQASASSGGTGKLSALEADSGNKQWEVDVNAGFTLDPAVRDRTVYHVGEYGAVSETSFGGENQGSYGAGFLPSGIAIGDGTLYGNSNRRGSGDNVQDASFGAVDTSEQSQQWTFDTGNERTAGPPAIGNGAVYGASNDTVYKVDSETGDAEWTTTFDASISASPVKYGDSLLVVSDRVTALSTADGTEKWSTSSGTGGGYEPVLVDGRVYVSAGDTLRAFE